MILKTETYTIQKNLANYRKTGNLVDLPGITKNRVHHYHRLIYTIVDDTLSTAFPITHKNMDPSIWKEMVHLFFSVNGGKTPQLWKLSFEFYEYAKAQSFDTKYQFPWLIDLLWFEWLEIDLFMMEDIPYPPIKEKSDWLKDTIVLNPEHRLVKLSYPVFKYSPDQLDDKKGEYFLLIYREEDTGKVQFVGISALHAYVLDSIQNNALPLEKIISNIIYLFGINDINLLNNNLLVFLDDLREKGFMLGFQ